MSIEIHSNPAQMAQMAGLAGSAQTPAPADAAKPLAGNDKGLVVTSSSQPATVDAIPEGALTRDDGIGRLVSAAYCFPPPPFPSEIS